VLATLVLISIVSCSYVFAGGKYCTDSYDGMINYEVPHRNPGAPMEADLDRKGDLAYLVIKDVKTGAELRYDSKEKWTAPLNGTAGICWNPTNNDEVFTSIYPRAGDAALYLFNYKNRKVKKILDAKSFQKSGGPGGRMAVFYPKNISKDGKYLLVDYEESAEGIERLHRYIVNTEDGSVVPFKDFKKKHGSVDFMDFDISEKPRTHDC
jgi:hypothetical protein